GLLPGLGAPGLAPGRREDLACHLCVARDQARDPQRRVRTGCLAGHLAAARDRRCLRATRPGRLSSWRALREATRKVEAQWLIESSTSTTSARHSSSPSASPACATP